MFGLSFGEVLIILVVALLVLGPERLPQVARTVGKGVRDLRRTTGGFRELLEEELYLDEPSRPKLRAASVETAESGPVARTTSSSVALAGNRAPEEGEEEGGAEDDAAPRSEGSKGE